MFILFCTIHCYPLKFNEKYFRILNENIIYDKIVDIK